MDVDVEKPQQKGGKKSKKKKRKDDDDEDLDAVLAELKLEYSGKKAPPTAAELAEADKAAAAEKEKKKKGKQKQTEEAEDDDMEEAGDGEEAGAGGTVKTAAQKRKEKKERQKAKAAKEAAAQKSKPAKEKAQSREEEKNEEQEEEKKPDGAEGDEDGEDEKAGGADKKKKKKKAGEKEEKKGKKGPGKGALAAMQEALKKVQEEEEKRKAEEAERIRKEEEAERLLAEKKRLEEERRAAKKQREKEKKEQLKKEGKYLTAKQKEAKARAEAMLEAMRAQGMDVPAAGEKKAPRPGTRIRPKKNQQQQQEEAKKEEAEPAKVEVEIKDASVAKAEEAAPEEDDDVKDDWAMSSDEEEEKPDVKEAATKDKSPESKEEEEDESSEEEDEESSEEDDSGSDEEDEAEDKRKRAMNRIRERQRKNEEARSTDELRAPVICVMGHVDTGKTKILDKLRRTNVQDGEAGGITQQIGATNVPIEVIREQCKMVKGFDSVKLPGLLIIDTPGHESFSNLRDRGSSLCDIAILVVDIMHNLEPQTIESINLLKKKKTPFVIALNKVDRLYEWKANRHKDIKEVVASQQHNTKLEFDKRSKEVITAMAEQGLNAALFYDNPDPKTYISMVPTSAHSGDGMGNLMALIVQLSQTMLAKRLAFSEELQATVLEVKAIPGLGTTIDIVLVNGTLREGDRMVVAGTEGPIVTPIKALLTPAKMQDLRVKVNYVEHKVLRGAQGVKISAKDLEKAIAGLNVLVAQHPDEEEILKEEMESRLQNALNAIKLKERGVFVQASTLGSLEALLEFLRTSKIPVE